MCNDCTDHVPISSFKHRKEEENLQIATKGTPRNTKQANPLI